MYVMICVMCIETIYVRDLYPYTTLLQQQQPTTNNNNQRPTTTIVCCPNTGEVQ